MLPVLLADIADLLQALAPILGVIIWAAWQVVSAMQANEDQKKKAPANRGEAPAGQQPGAAKNDDLRSEVDDFLRRLKDPDPEPQAAKPPRPRPEKPRRPRIEVLVDDSPAEAVSEQPRRVVEASAPSQRSEPSNKPKQRSKPKRQKPRPAKRPSIAEQASHLGERIAQADDLVEARIHEKFDHQLGSLATAEEAYQDPSLEASGGEQKPAAAEPVAQTIADMLRQPENVRNAVILNEILRRPTF